MLKAFHGMRWLTTRHDMHKIHHTDSNYGGMALSIPKHEQLTCRLQEKRICSREM